MSIYGNVYNREIDQRGIWGMGKTVARASFSVKSKTKKKKPVGPPLKVPNLEKRSREYLTVSEVNQLI